jgi:hypothetical protein
MLGYPDAARADLSLTLEDAREIGQAATLMVALCITRLTHIMCRNNAAAAAQSDEVILLASEENAPCRSVVAWSPSLLSSQLRRIALPFCKDIPHVSSWVEGIMLGQILRPLASITLGATLLISGVGVTAPSTTARADDCLTAPNSPAPQGSHWYYRSDRATQRKCWYVRAPGQPAQQVATTGPAAPLHSRPAWSGAPSPHVSAAPSVNAVRPIPAPTDKTVQQSAQEETASTPEVPAPQASTLAETSPQAAAPPAVTWPDASVAVAPVKAQETVEVPTAAPANSVSDNAERTAQRADPTNNPGMPIIIFPVLALGLVGVGIVIKNAAARRSRIIIDQAEPDTVDDQRQHEWRDEQYLDESLVDGQELGSLVSAVSEPGPLRDEAGAFQIAQENSERRDKLLQFCRDIDRMLQPPTSAQKEPLRRRTAA